MDAKNVIIRRIFNHIGVIYIQWDGVDWRTKGEEKCPTDCLRTASDEQTKEILGHSIREVRKYKIQREDVGFDGSPPLCATRTWFETVFFKGLCQINVK